MNRPQVMTLLLLRATYHGVQVGETDVEAWHATIGDLDFDDARAALIEHYSERREWAMPADIRQSVRRARKARLDAAPPTEPPPGLDPGDTAAYQRWLIADRHRAATGDPEAATRRAQLRHDLTAEARNRRGLDAARAALAAAHRPDQETAS